MCRSPRLARPSCGDCDPHCGRSWRGLATPKLGPESKSGQGSAPRSGPRRRRAPSGLAGSLACAVLVLTPACGQRGTPDDPFAQLETDKSSSDGARERAEAFAETPDWGGLTDLLAQPHASARTRLGPHTLRYSAEISVGPSALSDSALLPPVDVNEPVLERFSVRDTLALTWAAEPGAPPQFQLSQATEDLSPEAAGLEARSQRELTVIDERAWAALDGAGWYARPLESDLWQVWLDDAQRAALDLVELAGPAADIDRVEGVEHQGRRALRVSLRPSDVPHMDRVVEGLVPWRRDATVELTRAELILDAATGLWLAVDIELQWRFRDGADRPMRGRARLEGEVLPLAQAPSIAPPSESLPVPERDRPQLLRQRLLDGLAAP